MAIYFSEASEGGDPGILGVSGEVQSEESATQLQSASAEAAEGGCATLKEDCREVSRFGGDVLGFQGFFVEECLLNLS